MNGVFDALLLQRPNLFALGHGHSDCVASSEADRPFTEWPHPSKRTLGLFRLGKCQQHVEILARQRRLLRCADRVVVIGKKEVLLFLSLSVGRSMRITRQY